MCICHQSDLGQGAADHQDAGLNLTLLVHVKNRVCSCMIDVWLCVGTERDQQPLCDVGVEGK